MRNMLISIGLLLALSATAARAQPLPTGLDLANSVAPLISCTTTAPAPPALTQMCNLKAYGNYPHPFMAGIEFGSAGGSAGDYGGFIAFHTKADDGAGTMGEALVLTPGHHAYMPYGQYYARFNSPGGCAAGVACGTATWTFATPYANTNGVPQQPNCPSAMIQDESVPGQMWVASISAISATSVTYSYASLVDVPAAHTIDVYAACYALGF